MVEIIRELKDVLLEQMEKDVNDRGVERLDPDMVDMVKDLADAEKACWEAEYYRSVAEAMDNRSGYTQTHMQRGNMGIRRGYNMMGYSDSLEGVRNIMMTASPEEKERMRAELRSMLNM